MVIEIDFKTIYFLAENLMILIIVVDVKEITDYHLVAGIFILFIKVNFWVQRCFILSLLFLILRSDFRISSNKQNRRGVWAKLQLF